MQRYAASGTPIELERCAEILAMAPDEAYRDLLMTGESCLPRTVITTTSTCPENGTGHYRKRLAIPGLYSECVKTSRGWRKSDWFAEKPSTDLGTQLEVPNTLGEVKYSAAVPTLLKLATGQYTQEPALQRVAIDRSQYDDASIEITRFSFWQPYFGRTRTQSDRVSHIGKPTRMGQSPAFRTECGRRDMTKFQLMLCSNCAYEHGHRGTCRTGLWKVN